MYLLSLTFPLVYIQACEIDSDKMPMRPLLTAQIDATLHQM